VSSPARRWGLLALAGVLTASLGWLALGPAPLPALAGWETLDTRWGTYLSERQWGTPHEAVDGNGWGLDPLEAIRRDYRYGEDGIAGLTDRDGTFNLGWALWDGEQPRITERLFGRSNPGGAHGEEIVDQRVFGANTPTSSYTSQVLRYPNASLAFEVTLEQARADSVSGVLRATARNTADAAGSLDLLLKGWFHDAQRVVELIDDGILLHGPSSVVALVGADPDGSAVVAAKRDLDRQLRGGGLSGSGPGHIGALARHLELAGGASGQAVFAWAEAETAAAAEEQARALLADAEGVLSARRDEASRVFAGEVTDHQPLYRQALMSLLWSQSLYTWDGASDYDPAWAGKVAADDVLIMPDKWEFPWLATWDTGFQAVTAALIDPQLGADQLRFLFSDRWQQPDGHLPCAEWVMATECPPVFAWSAWRVFQAGAGDDFLDEVRPGLERLYEYWWQHLAVEPSGLFSGGFLGMDNLPRAPGRAQADASGWMAFFATHLALIEEELGDAGRAAELRADAERIGQAINASLWDEATGFYYDQDSAPGELIRTPSYSGLIPLIAGIVPEQRRVRLLDALRDPVQFATPYGIRSVSRQSLLYEPGYASAGGVNSNWRGPIWVPINYLLVEALADIDPALSADLRQRVVDMVEADWSATGRLHEYFDAESGAGLGADAQAGWTALVANLIAEGWPAD
jgi:hypothetical protein